MSIEPMRLQSKPEEFLDEIESDTNWAIAEKLRGNFIFFTLRNSGNSLVTRNFNEVSQNVPCFSKVIPFLNNTTFIGEIMSQSGYKKEIRDEGELRSILGSVPSNAIEWQQVNGEPIIVLHDIISYQGKSVENLSFKTRRDILSGAYKVLRDNNIPVRLEKLRKTNKRAFYKQVIEEGGEGVVAKHLTGTYESGKRSKEMVKIKGSDTYDFIILGFTEGKGKYKNQIGAIKYGFIIDAEPKVIGTASGMKDTIRLDMTHNPKNYIGKVGIFKAQEITKYGVMLHPVFIDLHPEKSPAEVTYDDFKLTLIK